MSALPRSTRPDADQEVAQDEVRHTEIAATYLQDLRSAIAALDTVAVGRLADRVVDALGAGRTVHVAGNGGSATTASHMATDWRRACLDRGWASRVTSLGDSTATITATANDDSYAEVFATQLIGCEPDRDTVLLLSVSGRSPNIVRAAEAARSLGLQTLALVGLPGEVADLATERAVLDEADYGLVEDLQLAFNHLVVRAIRRGSPTVCARRGH